MLSAWRVQPALQAFYHFMYDQMYRYSFANN